MGYNNSTGFDPDTKKIFFASIAGLILLVLLIFSGKLFENVDAEEIAVIQSPISGKLSLYTTPGVKWQGFGKVANYYKLDTYEFEVPIRFNDGYKTTQKEVRTKDPMTGQDKTITVVEIVNDDKGGFARQEEAVLRSYGIKVTNFAVKGLPYDETIEKQIKQQQDLIMQVQTAIASAKEAEQRSITVAKEGEANAAKAKWDQEVVKAQKVTEAQQKLEVAGLDAQAAAAEKRANILRGEGEAERKRLVMNADGALDKKLEALVKINTLYADAIKGYQGNWVPTVQMGKDGNAGGGATALVDLLTAKTAQDLGVSLDVKGKGNTQ